MHIVVGRDTVREQLNGMLQFGRCTIDSVQHTLHDKVRGDLGVIGLQDSVREKQYSRIAGSVCFSFNRVFQNLKGCVKGGMKVSITRGNQRINHLIQLTLVLVRGNKQTSIVRNLGSLGIERNNGNAIANR